jgi:nucleotide-binding universal stress UspA family protein
MKWIVVAIDFSKCSIHALEYAIEIANKIKSNILMVWVDNSVSSEEVFPEEECEIRFERKRHFEKLREKYKDKLTGGKFDFKLRKGKVYHEITKQAKNVKAELLISGTHGISGFEEFWIGSNAYKIVIHSPCPVITVRYDFKFKSNINKILLPIDGSAQTAKKVYYTAKFAKYYNSEAHILALYSNSLKSLQRRTDSNVKIVKKYLEDNNISYKLHSLVSENITYATMDYASKNEIDLIVIMTEQEISPSRSILGTTAQQIISNSKTPVLSLHENGFSLE